MKNDIHRRLCPLSLAFVVLCGACSKDDDPEIPPTPQPSGGIVGELTYSTPVIGGGNGTGTATDPAVVHYGETLSVEVSQKTSYTDPNGEVFACEPKAVIKLSVAKDTLYAKDLQALLEHNESKSDPTTATAGEKKTVQQLQTFNVGGNEITFDHAYEIYTHVNSLGKSVFLPYLKDGLAKIGKPEANESEAAAAPARVVGISVSPLAPSTRAGSINDTTAYVVSVSFTVDLTSVNSKEAKTQSLYFKVDYIGVVESTTEIPDPKTEFSYELSHHSGTGSTSPFEVTLGDTLSLEWSGVSSYQYFSIPNRTGMEIKYEPKAFSKVYAEADTLWIKDVADLNAVPFDPVVATSGTNPVENTGLYAWNIAGHKVMVNYGYQLYQPIMIEGTEVVFPSLAIASPEINLQVTEKATTKTAKVYAVTLTIGQELTVVNASEPQSERVQYVVKYIAAIPIEAAKIVDIRYRKPSPATPVWWDPHDNIPLAYQYKLLVDTIFSDGSVHTAEIYGMSHPVSWSLNDLTARNSEYGEVKQDINGETVYFFANQDELVDETYCNVTISRVIAVPDTAKITLKDYGEDGPDPADWTRYFGYDFEHPQPGWYMTNLAPCHHARIYYDGRWLMFFNINFIWYNDIYYAKDVINGERIISFLGDENDVDDVSYEPDINFDITTGTTVLPDGKEAKSFVHTCTGWMLGWDQPFVFKIKLYFITYDPESPPF